MSVFRARPLPTHFDGDPAICTNCLSECDSVAREPICEDCQREDEKMEDESKIRWMNGNDKERRETA